MPKRCFKTSAKYKELDIEPPTEKLEKMTEIFKLNSNFTPRGDQPQAIEELIKGLNNNEKDQVLLGPESGRAD